MVSRKKLTWQNVVKQILVLFLCFIVIAPFYMVVVNSFKSKGEAARMSMSLPAEWHFENYSQVVEKGKLVRGFLNSLIYAGLSSFLAVLTSAMAGFVICRNSSRRMVSLYYFIICGLFLPINFVTLSKVLQTLNLSDSRWGLIIAFLSSMLPFCVFVIRNFIVTIPVDVDEAAIIDGAGPLQLFFVIIVPLLQPILITAFILQFMGVWSDFITPLYLTSKSSMWPMNLAVYNFFGKNSSYWNLVFADIVLTCLPVIVVYLLGQRYILSGITSGSVKG